MKGLWKNMSEELDRQKLLTDKMVVEMTQQKYRDKLSQISLPETVGTIVCFGMAAYALFNFRQARHLVSHPLRCHQHFLLPHTAHPFSEVDRQNETD